MVFSSPHHHFFRNFGLDQLQPTPAMGNLAMWCEELALPHIRPDDYQAAVVSEPNIVMPPQHTLGIESPGSMTSYPERLGISDTVVPICFPEINMAAGTEYNYYDDPLQLLEGEYCSELVSNFWPAVSTAYQVANGNFEVKEDGRAEEGSTLKVGKYTVEERKHKIMKYLKKRNQRNFNKTIKYACRKTLADKRVRVRGRFARNNSDHHHHHQPSEVVEEDHQETVTQKNMMIMSRNAQPEECLFNDVSHVLQVMKQDYEEEDWLQEAMATLMY